MNPRMLDNSFTISACRYAMRWMIMIKNRALSYLYNSVCFKYALSILRRAACYVSNSFLFGQASDKIHLKWHDIYHNSRAHGALITPVSLAAGNISAWVSNSRTRRYLSDIRKNAVENCFHLFGVAAITAASANIVVSALSDREISPAGYICRLGFVFTGLMALNFRGRWQDASKASSVIKMCERISENRTKKQ